jgi:hypothetical protein
MTTRLIRFESETTAELINVRSIQSDLVFVRDCCDELIGSGAIDDTTESDVGMVTARALYSAALIAYARCFATGRRQWLSEQDFESVSHEALQAHRRFMRVRHQDLAHTVLPFDQIAVSVGIDDHSRSVTTVGHLQLRRVLDLRETTEVLRNLARVMYQVLALRVDELEDAVLDEARAVGYDELLRTAQDPIIVVADELALNDGPPV